ncbi:MAG: hypothetical protein ACKV2V_07755 [Blastocatellia bacterium]
MKLKTAWMVVGLLFAMWTVAMAAAVDGKWVGQVPGRDGATQETVINLKAEGETLTGTISGRGGETAISEGTIKGDDLAFKVVREFNGNKIVMNYKGKLAGDEIKFTRTFEGPGPGGQSPPPLEFVAKRAK